MYACPGRGPVLRRLSACGYCFGQLGYDLVEARGLRRFQARTYEQFAYGVCTWTRDMCGPAARVRSAFAAANQMGDVTTPPTAANQYTNFSRGL